jgi:hypothetical protein
LGAGDETGNANVAARRWTTGYGRLRWRLRSSARWSWLTGPRSFACRGRNAPCSPRWPPGVGNGCRWRCWPTRCGRTVSRRRRARRYRDTSSAAKSVDDEERASIPDVPWTEMTRPRDRFEPPLPPRRSRPIMGHRRHQLTEHGPSNQELAKPTARRAPSLTSKPHSSDTSPPRAIAPRTSTECPHRTPATRPARPRQIVMYLRLQ